MLSEIYKGRKLSIRSTKEHKIVGRVNGKVAWSITKVGQDAEAKEMQSLKNWVDGADERRKTDPKAYPSFWYRKVSE